jgi:hypothetical protein
MMSDAQFQDKHDEIQGMIDNLGTKLASTPEDARNTTDYLKMKDQLAQALQTRDEHWKQHAENPSALLRLVKMVGKDLHFPQKPASPAVAPPTYIQPSWNIDGEKVPTGPAYKVQGPQTPEQMKTAKEAEQLIAAAPLSPDQDAARKYTAQINAQLSAIDKSGMSDENKERAREAVFKIYQKTSNKVYRSPDGTIYAADINDPDSYIPGSVPYKEDTINSVKIGEFKAAQADGYTGTIAQFLADSTKSKAMQAEWTRAHYGGRDMDQLSPEEADRAMAKYKEESSPVTTSTGQSLVFDQNNQPHVFTHTGTSHKTFSGANGAPAATPPAGTGATQPPAEATHPQTSGAPAGASTATPPKTLGDVKKKAAALNPAASGSSKGPIGPALDFKKMTPDVAAANKKYEDAVGLVDYAEKVKQHPDNAQEQRDFAIMMERTMSGRFQTAAYDLEVKNSGVANTFQQWLNDLSTGALPPKILNNLVQAAHDYKDAAAAEVAAAKGGSGATPNAGSANPQDGGKSLADRLHEAYGAKKQ